MSLVGAGASKLRLGPSVGGEKGVLDDSVPSRGQVRLGVGWGGEGKMGYWARCCLGMGWGGGSGHSAAGANSTPAFTRALQ